MSSKVAVAVLAGCLLAPCAHAAQSQPYPTKPIRVIVPQAPGGSNDTISRYIAARLSERLGRQIVVDNRPGADGMIATELVARANPDGYTLLMASTAFTMNPAVIRKLPYDPIRDFDWVAMFARGPVMITVGPSLPVSSLQELIAVGKAKKNYLTLAAAGGFSHFVAAMFRSHAGFDGVIVLYKGGAPALIDVMSGQAHIGVATVVTANAPLRTGKLKPLAVSSAKRLPAYPDVPTAAEAGLPSYDAAIWWAWATTAGTPPSVLERLTTEIKGILDLPESARRFGAESADIEYRSPAEMRKMIPVDLAKWDKVARDAGMQKQ